MLSLTPSVKILWYALSKKLHTNWRSYMCADRLLSLLMLLQIRGRLPAHQLAKRLGVSERTIYRDIEARSAAGVPVYSESGPGRRCDLAEGYRPNLTRR